MTPFRLLSFWFAVGAFLIASSLASAADVPTSPVLRIETGMHGAAINKLVYSPADQQLISVSDDKTARSWSVASGEPTGILRGPIADGGPEGALYALALSPSGKTLIVGGHTGLDWDRTASLYAFNRETSAWIGRIGLGDTPADVVTAIAFSPDGKSLAVGTNDRKGLRLVDLGARTTRIADGNYADGISGLDFAKDGRLVTASLDGSVRLYDAKLNRTAVYKAPAPSRPWSVAFSPDGSKIAVGFLGAQNAAVLGAADLKLASTYKGGEGRQGELSVVSWSADGRTLYGAGTYGDARGRKLIRRWETGASAKASDIGVADDTVTDLRAVGNGIAYATAAPAWGIVTADGTGTERRGRAQADFRDAAGGFRVSNDGSIVDFGFAKEKTLVRFNLLDDSAALEADPAPRRDLRSATENGPGDRLVDWRNGRKPSLDGRPLTLDDNELSRSVVALPDKSILMGTDYYLRLYAGGRLAWRTTVPSPAWAVNVSGDGRLALAALGDGSVRWYRVADGVELLALYVHPDRQRWVVWTPEGFFDHGPGGKELIGYHLNRVEDTRPRGADFVRIEQLYELYYRRDLVVKKFQGDKDDEVTRQIAKIGNPRQVLGRGLPPSIRLAEYCIRSGGSEKCQAVPAPDRSRGTSAVPIAKVDSPEIVLRYEVEDRGGGFGPVTLRRKDASVPSTPLTRSVAGKLRNEERTTRLEPGGNLLSLSAFNSAKEIETDSKERPRLLVNYTAPKNDKPVLRVVAVGIDKFRSPDVPQLKNAAADAKGIVEKLRTDRKQAVYSDIDAVVLADEEATLPAILAAFKELSKRAKPEDLALVFLAGHGVALDGRYFYLPYDLPDGNPESIRQNGLSHEKLTSALGELQAVRSLVVLDTCYSGAFAISDSIGRASADQTVGNKMSHASGRFILAGSSSEEEALDGIDGHGVLTSALIAGLAGEADRFRRGDNDGKVNIYELSEYAKATVPDQAAKIGRGHVQRPRSFFSGADMFDIRAVD